MFKKQFLVIFIILSSTLLSKIQAQEAPSINWISFNQLNDSLKLKQKKVFVNFHATWCVYCKEMNRTTFKDEEVIKELNQNYYAVSMDVESKEKVIFGEQIYINKRIKKLNPIHEIAVLLASRQNKAFSLPAFILFDDNFKAKARYFQYLDKNAMLKILREER